MLESATRDNASIVKPLDTTSTPAPGLRAEEASDIGAVGEPIALPVPVPVPVPLASKPGREVADVEGSRADDGPSQVGSVMGPVLPADGPTPVVAAKGDCTDEDKDGGPDTPTESGEGTGTGDGREVDEVV